MGCSAEPTNALDLGQHWPDGRRIYVTACAQHTMTCYAFQQAQGVTAIIFPIWAVEIVGPCSACWGSHGCDLPDDHEGDHICGSRDPDGVCMSPDDRWEIFHIETFEPCARTGGVKR